MRIFAFMTAPWVNIHTHRPTGRGIELRTAGIHPWKAAASGAGGLGRALDELDRELDGAQAVGEIGLDLACGVPLARQEELFRAQLELAERRGLPVVLHCVRAFEPVMKELERHRLRAVIFHGFIGSPQQARRALARGCMLSFGERTFASPRTLEALRATPLGQLFVETDESPTPIGRLYERVAEARGVSVETLREAAWENYKRIFETT